MQSVFRYIRGSGNMALMLPILIRMIVWGKLPLPLLKIQ